MIESLKRKTPFLIASEYGKFLGKKGCMEGISGYLTDIYDNKAQITMQFRKNREHGEMVDETAYEPCINILGSTAPGAFSLSDSDLADGFYGRHWIWQGKMTSTPVPKIRPIPDAEWEGLRQRVRNLAAISGDMTLSPEADALHDRMYVERWFPEIQREQGSKSRSSGIRRMSTNSKKLAMLLAASEGRMEITGQDMAKALALAEWLFKSYCDVLDILNESPLEKRCQKVKDYLRKHGKTNRSELSRHSGCDDVRKFNEALDALGDEIRITFGEKVGNGKATEWITLAP